MLPVISGLHTGMIMNRELLTFPLSHTQLRDELAYTLDYLGRCDFTSCQLLFGYAWGLEYYLGNDWEEESLALHAVLEKVSAVEAQGLGSLGMDNLHLVFPGFSFRFCDESDIHLSFSADSPLIEHFFARWQRLGYQPAEWLINDDGSKVMRRGGDSHS